MNNSWLSKIGLFGVLIVLLVGVTSFTHNTLDFRYPFMVIGILLSLIVYGIGEIINILKRNR